MGHRPLGLFGFLVRHERGQASLDSLPAIITTELESARGWEGGRANHLAQGRIKLLTGGRLGCEQAESGSLCFPVEAMEIAIVVASVDRGPCVIENREPAFGS